MEENSSSTLGGGASPARVASGSEGPRPFMNLNLPAQKAPGGHGMKFAVLALFGLLVLAVLLIAVATYLDSRREAMRVPAVPVPAAESVAERGVAADPTAVPRPTVVNSVVDVPVTNYVVRRIDVMVDYPVTNYVIRPQVVVVEYPVTNVVVQPYEVVVEYPVTNVVVQPYEIVVEQPVTNGVYRPFADGPAAVAAERPTVPERSLAKAEKAPPPPPPVIRRPLRSSTPYRVVYGDTVSKLAVRFGFRIQDFRECNPGLDMERIVVGRTIQLPGDIDLEP